VRTTKGTAVKTPKSAAGSRDVPIAPHTIEQVRHHLDHYTDDGRDALLFPADHGGNLAPSTWNRHWYKARAAAGRPDLHLHDLRHSSLTWMAQAGATTRELMDAAGHSSPAAALRYQHVADGRRRELAARLSKIADES
jgi:integrase